MRIMIDTNIIVSAVYNPQSKPAKVLHHVCENHVLVLCDYIVAECYDVIKRKFPQHIVVLDKLLASLGYDLVSAPRAGLIMSDPKDSPILNAAILSDVDIVISGDGHFLSLDFERPKVLAPAQYLANDGNGDE
jgi:putative PIN family toxin of toxin-antitoxin system